MYASVRWIGIGGTVVAILLFGSGLMLLAMTECPAGAFGADCGSAMLTGAVGMGDCSFCGMTLAADAQPALAEHSSHAWAPRPQALQPWSFPFLPWRPPS